jgi:hypothetical protein
LVLLDLVAAFFTSKTSTDWKIVAVLSAALAALLVILIFVR